MVTTSALCSHIQKSSERSRLYVPAATRERNVALERLLHTHSAFSKSVMVSMDVFNFGRMDSIFINAGVNIDHAYYREVLLTQELLPVMRENCDEFLIFRQGNASAHHGARQSPFWNRRHMRSFHQTFGHPTAQVLSQVDYKIWADMEQMVYQVHDDELK